MTESDKIFNEILSTLDSSVNKFSNSLPGLQDDILTEVISLIRDLEITNGRIDNSVKNLRTIGKIETKLKKIILNPDYKNEVGDFIDTFNQVATLQNQYFSALESEFKPSVLVKEIKNQAIGSTVADLTEAGIDANLIKPIQDILRQNITTGGTVKSFISQMTDFITGTPEVDGALVKYAGQITTDAIHQYSAQYMSAVSGDLGWKWYMYSGTLITTSREFCKEMVKKKYVHESEFSTVLNGDINGKQIPISSKSDLPYGLIDGTTPANFQIYRGGYNCGHQLRPIPDVLVPENIRSRI